VEKAPGVWAVVITGSNDVVPRDTPSHGAVRGGSIQCCVRGTGVKKSLLSASSANKIDSDDVVPRDPRGLGAVCCRRIVERRVFGTVVGESMHTPRRIPITSDDVVPRDAVGCGATCCQRIVQRRKCLGRSGARPKTNRQENREHMVYLSPH